ncbi:5-(carboxyamino)imidazole ribonucleotide synthase [Vagococcus xieshaowenii]|uniref:N5-carboxyaminoimidazole ribonucleotide synthase n=1 Tax=Vagococcus xieshaowenii TaxID=2562451 RepID=A0AAJ5EHC7_9ENTE|nr:5-(carboxyamino)imidazole ribonucleotide synthase [Vagococcus xieshaowenii]QCA28810.1 5-(carboxyamino)imidazole ribonucleotide synthase [Vagococcus xieshaowenii]TFZ42989.1 5-(carboxyamino)imidazole ribonucleotide synthase [Vagococcus xieshaowenii]
MNSQTVLPGSTIGIIGGGQLGQMLAMSAKEMGYRVNVLDPNKYCPAASVANHFIQCAYDDVSGLTELAKKSNLLTYEFENVSASALKDIPISYSLPQGTDLLEITQDRVKEKQFLAQLKLPIASFSVIDTLEDLLDAIEVIGYPCVLKTTRGGYDGKGQVVIKSFADVEMAKGLLIQKCVLEEWLTFDKELSVIVAGNPQGEYVTFPCAENLHHQNILHQTIVPARVCQSVSSQASNLALEVAKKLHLTGVLAIEMFVVGQKVYINELAPRPHNSGHYSIEACDVSQFDLHIKGICGLPLASPNLLSSVVMVNVLGQHLEDSLELMLHHPTWHFHYYGKEQPQFGRKMGHITILSEDITYVLTALKKTTIWN